MWLPKDEKRRVMMLCSGGMHIRLIVLQFSDRSLDLRFVAGLTNLALQVWNVPIWVIAVVSFGATDPPVPTHKPCSRTLFCGSS